MCTPEQKAKQIGATGGTVDTNGMPWQQKERIDKAVTDGRNGS